MGIKDVKHNPELLKPLKESLDLLSEEKRNDFIAILLKHVLRIIKKVQVYVKLKNIDYKTALYQVIVLRRRLASACKDDF
jgi:hypothetical protein